MFIKTDFLKNFAIISGKHLCSSLLFNKVAGLRPATLLKRRLQSRCLAVNIVKLFRTPFSTEHLRWLLLTTVTIPQAICHWKPIKSLAVSLSSSSISNDIKRLCAPAYLGHSSTVPSALELTS